MSSSIGVFPLPRRFYLGGSAASILFHLTVVAVAVLWSTRALQPQKGALPPVVSVQLGAYQLEKAPPQVVEGPKQVFSAPEPRQQQEQPEEPVLDTLPVVAQGTLEKRVKVRDKPRPQKKEIQPEVHNEPAPQTTESVPATSAYSAGEATRSVANFTSAAQQAISGQVGWESLLHTHLAKFKRYPRAALRYRATGISHVSMVLNAQGQVIEAAIVTTSGNRILDNEALDIVKRATPLPAPPPHALNSDGQVQVVAPISFYL